MHTNRDFKKNNARHLFDSTTFHSHCRVQWVYGLFWRVCVLLLLRGIYHFHSIVCLWLWTIEFTFCSALILESHINVRAEFHSTKSILLASLLLLLYCSIGVRSCVKWDRRIQTCMRQMLSRNLIRSADWSVFSQISSHSGSIARHWKMYHSNCSYVRLPFTTASWKLESRVQFSAPEIHFNSLRLKFNNQSKFIEKQTILLFRALWSACCAI